MASISWPGGLPSLRIAFGPSGQAADLQLRSAVDRGPSKVRRKQTRGVKPHDVTLVFESDADMATLETFYEDTTKGGALAFDYTDPVTKGTKEFRFRDRYSFSQPRPGYYRVRVPLEELP